MRVLNIGSAVMPEASAENKRVYPGLAKARVSSEPLWVVSKGLSDCTELAGDLRRDVEVSCGQMDHVGKRLQLSEAPGAVLDDFDDAVDTFCDVSGCYETLLTAS